jgi:hypothetical protein
MNHLIRGDVVEDQRDHFRIVQTLGDRDEILGAAREIFRPGAIDRQRADTLTKREVLHALADRVNFAGDFVALDVGEGGSERVVAGTLQNIRVAAATRLNADPYLAFLRRFQRQLDFLKLVEPTLAPQLNGSIRLFAHTK